MARAGKKGTGKSAADRRGRARRASRRAAGDGADKGVDQVVIWTLRALLHAVGEVRSAFKVLFRCDEATTLVGLGPFGSDEARRPGAIVSVRRMLARATALPPLRDEPIYRNIERLGGLIGLNPVEREILAFAVKCAGMAALAEPLGMITPTSRSRLCRALGAILEPIRPEQINAALERDSALVSTGLVRWASPGNCSSDGVLKVMDDLDAILGSEVLDDAALLTPFFRVAPSSTLSAADFPHLGDDVDLLCRFLGRARKEGRKGINVLLYGAPGTGKTELARVIAARVGELLYEVNVADRDDNPIESKSRLTSYLLCQRFLGRISSGLVFFDESEDLFPAVSLGFFGMKMRSAHQKGFTNRLLEANAVPAIWVTNSIDQIDRAVLRRFVFQLELRIPPRSVRRVIVQKHLACLAVSGGFLYRLASCDNVSPADVKAAAQVAELAADADQPAVEATVARVLSQRIEARGERLTGLRGAEGVIPYRVEYLNASRDPGQLAEALRRRPRGSVLLYGPPGTGKTEYARHVAERLDKPLLARRASDLLNPFVGMTEKYIAEMFHRAREEDAVLLLDEADSFLRDRRGAFRSWEVTQVNELLVGMEQFEGLFLCSTNMVDEFDQAAFRRFVVKVRFDYLRSEQAWAMLKVLCAEVNVAPDEHLRPELSRLRLLTPGDFAVVRRQFLLEGDPASAERVVARLDEECRMKKDREGGVAEIGFRG
jgi:transitional endoplasmic reticulum ATPase